MQTAINLKDINFDKDMLANIALFDEVLSDVGEPPLLENKNFAPFLDFPVIPSYLVLEVNSQKSNILPIVIWLEGNSLRIDIDGMNESFEWAQKHIYADRNSVIELIRNLFTGYISVETGRISRFVQIFDSSGFFVKSFSYNNLFHMITGLYIWRYKYYRRLYLPLFSKDN